MASYTPKAFLARSREKLDPVILLTGDSTWEKERVLQGVEALMGEDVSRDVFQPARGEPTADEVRSLFLDLASPPLFGGRRLIIARGGDATWKQGGKALARMAAEGTIENAVVLFCQRTPTGKSTKGPGVAIVACSAPKSGRGGGDAPVKGWARERAKELGFSLSTDGAQALVELAGTEQTLLDEELQKIGLWAYRGEGAKSAAVGSAEVESLVPLTAGRGFDRLLGAILEKRVRDALTVLGEMRERGFKHFSGRMIVGDSFASTIMASLQDRYRKIVGVIEASEVGQESVRERLNIKSDGYWRFLSREARQLGRRRAEASLCAIAETEYSIRLDGAPLQESLEMLIVALCRLD